MSNADTAVGLERKSGDSSCASTGSTSGEEEDVFALVKHPSDPGNPDGKLALGVRCRKQKKATQTKKERKKSSSAGQETAAAGAAAGIASTGSVNRAGNNNNSNSGAAAEVQQVSASRVPYYPRPTRPACVPSKALSCFCTVDILYD